MISDMKMIGLIKCILYAPIMWIYLILYIFLCDKKKVDMDLNAFCKVHKRRKSNGWKDFYTEFISYREFRSLFYVRSKPYSKFFRWMMPGEPLLAIGVPNDKLGGGLFLQHGYATDIEAVSVGENCWINQKVSIAFGGGEYKPTIGNNVRIGVGAIIIGNVHIGNNVNIGAAAIVVKDVPDNCTVVSSSTYIVKRDGIKVKEKLN